MKRSGKDGNDLPRGILEAALELWSQSGSEHTIPVTGTSMLPLLQEGDEVLVRSVVEGARRGDILVFRQGGELISHRLLAVTQNQDGDLLYLTKGDNLLHPDPPVRKQEILGVVLAVKRGERLLSFDTRLWRGLNRFIAWNMRLQLGLYQMFRNNRAHPIGESLPEKVSIPAAVLRRVNYYFLRILQVFHSGGKSK